MRALVLTLAPAALAQARTDLTGKWMMSVQTDNGTGTPMLTLKQNGDSLTGTYASQVFGNQAVMGTVSGKKVAFWFTASAEGQSLRVTYTGTVEADGSLKGTVDLGGFGSGTWTARLDKPASPPPAVESGRVRIGTTAAGAVRLQMKAAG